MLACLLDRWCRPLAVDPRHDTPAAWLASSPTAPGVDDAFNSGLPTAVWVRGAEDVAVLADRDPRAVLVSDAAGEVDDDVMVVGGSVDVQRYVYMSPFVRARWRAAHGLPETMVAVIDAGGADVDYDAVPTALALASAVA